METKRWVWDGLELCEERNTNNAVTKRYYAQGLQVVSGSNVGSYFYTRDHLGSVRELTDSAGTVRARYDYDVWGNRSGNLITANPVEADFGYTGHYYHAASGLCLAPYRAYDPTIGRWISRDPLGEAGGLNLYQYALNDPINWFDPDGLIPVTASEFGGGSESGMSSAYGGTVNPNSPQAALPARVPSNQRNIKITNPKNGKSVVAKVNDVGPWNTNDPYWKDCNKRPAAESQYANKTKAQNGKVPTNPAGIDLTPAAMNALGITGAQGSRQATVDWSFVP